METLINKRLKGKQKSLSFPADMLFEERNGMVNNEIIEEGVLGEALITLSINLKLIYNEVKIKGQISNLWEQHKLWEKGKKND